MQMRSGKENDPDSPNGHQRHSSRDQLWPSLFAQDDGYIPASLIALDDRQLLPDRQSSERSSPQNEDNQQQSTWNNVCEQSPNNQTSQLFECLNNNASCPPRTVQMISSQENGRDSPNGHQRHQPRHECQKLFYVTSPRVQDESLYQLFFPDEQHKNNHILERAKQPNESSSILMADQVAHQRVRGQMAHEQVRGQVAHEMNRPLGQPLLDQGEEDSSSSQNQNKTKNKLPSLQRIFKKHYKDNQLRNKKDLKKFLDKKSASMNDFANLFNTKDPNLKIQLIQFLFDDDLFYPAIRRSGIDNNIKKELFDLCHTIRQAFRNGELKNLK